MKEEEKPQTLLIQNSDHDSPATSPLREIPPGNDPILDAYQRGNDNWENYLWENDYFDPYEDEYYSSDYGSYGEDIWEERLKTQNSSEEEGKSSVSGFSYEESLREEMMCVYQMTG